MFLPEHNCQFAKIFVQCHENTAHGMRPAQNFTVARISRPITAPIHFVPVRGKLQSRFTPHARVEQNLHAAALTSAGAKYSCDTTRLA